MMTLIASVIKFVSALAMLTYCVTLWVTMWDDMNKSKKTIACDDCVYLQEMHGKGKNRVWVCDLDGYDCKHSPVYYCRCHKTREEEETEVEDETC